MKSKLNSPPKRSKKILIGAGLGLLLLVALTPALINKRHQTRLHDCKMNLKNVSSAMEMYSTDWSGHYPTSLGQLAPKYLAKIPTCPNSHSEYKLLLGADAPGYQPQFRDWYYVFCEGENHKQAGVGKDRPAYPLNEPMSN